MLIIERNMFKNLKILELSNVLAGPAVGMFFAELGAKVVKIENKISGGDITRKWKLPEEKNDNASAYFYSVNYQKEYIQMDFTDKEERKLLNEHIENSTIIITNFKAGDAEKFNLSFIDCKKLNPKIIYAHIGGFKSIPKRVAFDVILQAETGFISMTGNKHNLAKMPVAMIDVLAAHQIKEGILTALLLQHKDPIAYKVTTTLEETALSSLMNQSANYLMANHIPKPMGTLHPNIAPYGDIIYCKEDIALILAIGTDKQFFNFCEIIHLPKNKINEYDTNQKRLNSRKELIDDLQQKAKLLNVKDLLSKCLDKSIPIGRVNDIKEVMNTTLAQKMILEEKINGNQTRRIKTVAFDLSN